MFISKCRIMRTTFKSRHCPPHIVAGDDAGRWAQVRVVRVTIRHGVGPRRPGRRFKSRGKPMWFGYFLGTTACLLASSLSFCNHPLFHHFRSFASLPFSDSGALVQVDGIDALEVTKQLMAHAEITVSVSSPSSTLIDATQRKLPRVVRASVRYNGKTCHCTEPIRTVDHWLHRHTCRTSTTHR